MLCWSLGERTIDRVASLQVYTIVVRRLAKHFGPMPLATIRPRGVAAYVRSHSQAYGPATLNRDLSALHDIF
jgi:hypothetical protein